MIKSIYKYKKLLLEDYHKLKANAPGKI